MPVILLPLGDKRLTKILLKAEFSSPLDQCSRCESKSCDSQKCPGQTLQLWPLEAVPLLGRPLVGRPLVMWPLVMWPLVLWPLLMWPLHEQPLLLQPLLVKPLVCYRCIAFPVGIGIGHGWLSCQTFKNTTNSKTYILQEVFLALCQSQSYSRSIDFVPARHNWLKFMIFVNKVEKNSCKNMNTH